MGCIKPRATSFWTSQLRRAGGETVVAGLGLSRRLALERVGNIGRSTIVEEREAAIHGRKPALP